MKIHKSGATRRNQRSSRSWQMPKLPLPSWRSFLLGIVVGIFATSFFYFKVVHLDVGCQLPGSKAKQPLAPTEAPPNLAAGGEAQPQPPQFDFYRELTKNDSQIDNKSKALDLKSSPKTINGYLVQVGAFKRRADAETLKAKLALHGISTTVETAKQSDGVWYRVLTGSFKTASAAKAQQKALQSFAKDSIIVHRYAN